ncbi:MAG: hypothetical protein ABR980_11700 [Ignavibacteriaceae bacterium]|jgi:hypothetical protein
MNNEINLKADFFTFKNQIVKKFGEQYFEQTELFIERAIAQANMGLLYNAAADGKFALELKQYSNDKTGMQYLIGFLSQLHCDLGQISKSKAYYELGMKFIDLDDDDDIRLFKNLKELIDSESWKGSIEDNTNE